MKILTTGQCAKLCNVAPRTVAKWFDSGRLKGYQIPGTRDRRIPQEYLIRFMREHGLKIPAQLSGDQDVAVEVETTSKPSAESRVIPVECFKALSNVSMVDEHAERGPGRVRCPICHGFMYMRWSGDRRIDSPSELEHASDCPVAWAQAELK